MGLLMSDSLMPDLLLDEALRLLDGVSELAYAPDVASDPYDYDAADPTESTASFRDLSRGQVRRFADEDRVVDPGSTSPSCDLT